MKKKLLFAAIGAAFLIPAAAVTPAEVQVQIASQGEAAVSGNIFLWFLCAVAFLKVSQKIDTFMASLGISVGRTGGSMLGELMIAFRGVQAASGGAFGRSGSRGSGVSSRGSGGDAPFLSGGFAGAVGRMTHRHAVSSVTNRQAHSISQSIYNSSVAKGGSFANTIIGAVAKGSINNEGTITGTRAVEAMTSYFGYVGHKNAPTFSEVEIGGGRIVGKESVGGAAAMEFAMYSTEQYLKPDTPHTIERAADGSTWYKQVPQDTVQRTPYMDAAGEIRYNEEIVQKLPQMPRRKERG